MIGLVRHILARARDIALGIVVAGTFVAPALASQATWVTPSAPLPMSSLASFLNNAHQALGTCNSGNTAPALGPSGAPIAQMCWWNTNSVPWTLNWYDGAQWDSIVTLNATTHQMGITNLAAPVNASDAATKQYVDNAAQGLTVHSSAALATAAALPTNTYNNGTSGVGATLTATANGALSVDGTAVSLNQRILVKNEATAANNGIYTVTATGGASATYVLTRATDANTAGTLDATKIGQGTYVLVTGGSTLVNSSWIVNAAIATIGTSAINWAQFSTGQGAPGSSNDIIRNSGGLLSGSNQFVFDGTNVGLGTTAPNGVDGNGSTFLTVNNATTNAWGEIAVGGNITGTANNAGEFNFYNSSLGTSDKRIASILGATSGATNSGQMQFFVWNAGTAQPVLTLLPSGNIGVGTSAPAGTLDVENGSNSAKSCLNGVCASSYGTQYTDLRIWASLSCNPASPSSTNVAAAIWAAYNSAAAWRYFYVPAGCFLNTNDAAWTAHFTAQTIPDSVHFLGGDSTTSGVSVCATYTGCTPGIGTIIVFGANSSLENMFYMDGTCYNLDGGAFGHPQYCNLHYTANSGNSGFDLGGYPGQPFLLNVSPSPNGTWNGTDQPHLALNNTTAGDVIFSNDVTTDMTANILNFFNRNGTVSQLKVDGKLSLGNSSTSHSGNGMILITDAFAACNIYTNTGGSPGFTCSSDRRLKERIKDAGSQLAWLDSFDVRQFDMRSNGEHVAAGVVAQEIRRRHPEMVHEGKPGKDCAPGQVDGCLSVEAPSPWRMMKAMQELHGEIEKINRRIQ